MSTGPGRPPEAIANASRTVSASREASFTMALCFVTGIATLLMSTSWNESRPICSQLTLPVMNTTGDESMYAAAMPVSRFVAPGPDVAKQTAVLPVARA
jgi:hypothetical protein